jgi:hypothetical protein
MTKSEKKQKLLKVLGKLTGLSKNDPEDAHGKADEALLEYIADPDITVAFDGIKKYYA